MAWSILLALTLGQERDVPLAIPIRAAYAIATKSTIDLFDNSGAAYKPLDLSGVTSLALHPSGQRITFLKGHQLHHLTLRSGAKPHVIGTGISKFSWAPAGSQLAYLTPSGLSVLNASTPSEPSRVLSAAATAFDWSDDGTRILAFSPIGSGGRIQILSLDGAKPRTILEGHGAQAVSWAPNGRRFAFLKPILGKAGKANLIAGAIGSRVLKNLAKEVDGTPSWSPDSRRVLIVGKATNWIVDVGAPLVSKLSGELENPQWSGALRIMGRRGNQVIRHDLSVTPAKVETVLTFPSAVGGVFARTPSYDLTNALISDDPFKSLRFPPTGRVQLRGYVDNADPLEDHITFKANLIRYPNGREQFMASPISVALTVNGGSREFGRDLPIRVMDFPFDQEIEIQVNGTSVTSGSALPIAWAFLPESTDDAFEAVPNFPRVREPVNFVWRQAVDTNVVVPMTFPAVGKVTYSDWWLKPRGGGTRRHIGQDLMAPKMTPMVACFDGEVSIGRDRGNAGHTVTIRNRSGWTAHYYHVNNDNPGTNDGRGGDPYAFAPNVVNGSRVVAGQFIGYVGNSGNAESTGPHIHFELWFDPMRVVVNAYASLRAAKKLTHPRYPDPAPFLRPANSEQRIDGIVSQVNPISKGVQYVQLATILNGKNPQVTTYPTWGDANLANSSLRLRHQNALPLKPEDIRPGMEVTLIAPKASLRDPRLVAVEGR